MMNDADDILVSLEGIDFTGKSTAVRRLGRELSQIGVRALLTRDPPNIEPWLGLKKTVFDRKTHVSAPAEALLFLTARVDNAMRRIRPALREGRIVIADRFSVSWVAYWAPKLSSNFGSLAASLAWLTDLDRTLCRFNFLVHPTKTYLLVDDPDAAVRRAPNKRRSKWETPAFLKQVQKAYLKLTKIDPDRFTIFDIRKLGISEAIDELVDDAVYFIGQHVQV